MKIGVLMGGNSGEREVSLASGAQVAAALREAGHEVVAIDTTRGVLSAEEERVLLASGVRATPPDPDALDLLDTGDTTALTRAPEVASTEVLFLALHGGSGEDGTLQALLDLTGLPYAGSGRVGCTLAMDKDLTKRLLRDAGIPTPDWILGERPPAEVVERLGLPVIVKPASGGSSLGMTLARSPAEVREATGRAEEEGDQVLYERFVRGRELTVGILGRDALPVGEIVPEHELFDYECKYQPGMAREIFPADLPEEAARRLQRTALRVHDVLRLRDFSRVDFILDGDGTAWCLEANALPGLTATSLLPKAARAAGMTFPQLCQRIAELALERWQVRGKGRAPAHEVIPGTS